jgi:hypothetical protein
MDSENFGASKGAPIFFAVPQATAAERSSKNALNWRIFSRTSSTFFKNQIFPKLAACPA